MKGKIIVTGGAGFIGSNLVEALNKDGITNIIIVDHLTTTGKWKNLRGLLFEEYKDREEFLLELPQMKNITAIIHLGACASTTETDENFLMRNNVAYSQKLFSYATKKDIPFLYASSGSVYGAKTDDLKENDSNLSPLNCYGYTKYFFDQWVGMQVHKPSQVVGLRFFNVYGPKEYHKGQMASMMYHGFAQVKKEGEIKLFKSYKEGYHDGEQKRDFIYVKDVVKVIQFFLKKRAISGVFNVGTGESRSFNDLAKAIFKSLDQKQKITYIEMPVSLQKTYQYYTRANMDKLRKAGYKGTFLSLEDGIDDYIKNHLLTL